MHLGADVELGRRGDPVAEDLAVLGAGAETGAEPLLEEVAVRVHETGHHGGAVEVDHPGGIADEVVEAMTTTMCTRVVMGRSFVTRSPHGRRDRSDGADLGAVGAVEVPASVVVAARLVAGGFEPVVEAAERAAVAGVGASET